MKIAYLSYPYSDNPKKRTEEVVEIAATILKKHNIFSIVPHLAVDPLRDMVFEIDLLEAEFKIISHCDIFIVGSKTLSEGMKWELAYAQYLNKPVYYYDERDGELYGG